MENDNQLKQIDMPRRDWMVRESDLEKDDYEYRVLHAVLDKSCIVSGCAGSGKSVLALIKAQRIQREKNTLRYKIIVYTKALCKYMNAGREELDLRTPFTYHWKFSEAGYPKTDYIIVDEIQDFDKEEIQGFISAANKHFFFFGDTAQSIYNGIPKRDGTPKVTMPVNRISSIVPDNKDFEIFNLCHNYRLPLPVAKVVQHIGIGLPPFNENIYKSPENSIPRFVKYNTLEEQIRSIAGMIKNNSVSDVGILVPFNEDVDRISEMLNKYNIHHELKSKTEENLDFTTDNPKVMTYHSAKGLQFENVFLPGIAPLNPARRESEQKALYVAMTRTYRNLYVMYSGSLPSPLREVPPTLYKTSITDIVEDI